MALLVVLGIRFWPPSEVESGRPVAPPPDRPVAWQPPDIVPAADAQIVEVGGLKFYDHIEKVVQDRRISFRLIPHEADSDPPTFYMMENKVSNDLFALALADPAFRNLLDEEAKAHPQTIQRQWDKGGLGEDGDNVRDLGMDGKGDWPVLRVTVTEAYLFARWLGGNLPTVKQWDKAGGGLNDDPRPCQGEPWGPEDIAINRSQKGPMPVGKAAKDRSRFQCRDMAGNGQEWTRTVRKAGETVPAANPNDKLFVVVRGRSYWAEQPFAFGDNQAIVSYLDENPYTSFRVVLEPLLAP
jgi:hypothetical protein